MSEGDQGHTRPSILPGSGLNPDNLPDFLRQLPDLKEIHLTASHVIDDPKSPRPDVGLKLGFGDNEVWAMNEDKLRAVFKVIDDLAQE
jgi:copper homeostasis protein CutC